jgi:hypothetical protein
MPQNCSTPIGVSGQGAAWQLAPSGPPPTVSQHAWPGRQAAEVVHATPEITPLEPPPNPKPPDDMLVDELQDTSATTVAAAAMPAITRTAVRCINVLPSDILHVKL